MSDGIGLGPERPWDEQQWLYDALRTSGRNIIAPEDNDDDPSDDPLFGTIVVHYESHGVRYRAEVRRLRDGL